MIFTKILAPALLGACLLGAGDVLGAQRVIIGTQLEPPVLDPTANPAAAISEILYGNVYEGLVQFGADGSPRPKLAVSWEIADDGLSYVFHLKNGVRFHVLERQRLTRMRYPDTEPQAPDKEVTAA